MHTLGDPRATIVYEPPSSLILLKRKSKFVFTFPSLYTIYSDLNGNKA